MKKILITGANSYIGDSVAEYLGKFPDEYSVTIKDTIGWKPEITDFDGIDVVFHVAGIAHRKENRDNAHLYYEINRDLAIAVAEVAKAAGVRHFIIMSTMAVYGMITGCITKQTKPTPKSHYGKSKLVADRAINRLSRDSKEQFIFTCLRPPMVYGPGCKGNYQRLRSFAIKIPMFPQIDNKRSMVYIGNLCWFIKDCIDHRRYGLFFPQNAHYVNTSNMVQLIAAEHGRIVILNKVFNLGVRLAPFDIVKKVFGDLVYEPVDLISEYSFNESILLTERGIKQ